MFRFFYAENTKFLISTNSCNKHITSQIHGGLVFISKSKIQFESKSQQGATFAPREAWCLSVSQRYNLKANHNNVKIADAKAIGVYQ